MNTENTNQPLHWMREQPLKPRAENDDVLARIERMIDAGEHQEIVKQLDSWDYVDIVQLFVRMKLKHARELFESMPPGPAAKVVAELKPGFRSALMEDSALNRYAEILNALDPDTAASELWTMPSDVVDEVLPRLSAREEVQKVLGYREDSAGSVMNRHFVAVPVDWRVGEVIDEIRRHAASLGKLDTVYVVDADRRLAGLVPVIDLLLLTRDTRVSEHMLPDVVSVRSDTDQEEAVRLAEQYDLLTIPVVDSGGHILGRITPDLLSQIIREEAEEDIKLMGGVSPEAGPDSSIKRIVVSRLPWLLVGLIGSSLAATVVGAFEEELAKAAILASFIPVVMAMAGNAGIQASTVAVQGLATGTLWLGDLGGRLVKELSGAVLNGLGAGLILAILVMAASQLIEIEAPLRLSIASGLSLVAVTALAAVIGAAVPIVLDRVGIDPAMATGVFITTSNDVLGVLIFFVMVTNVYLA